MNFLPPTEAEEEDRIVERLVLPAPVPDHFAKQQNQATAALHVRLWRWLKGYTAEDINRLKEAGVRRVEADADAKAAEAAQKVSEAERNFSEKERIKQEALLKRAEAVRTMAEAEKLSAEASKIRVDTVIDALERLSAAASAIRQNGGEVFFDGKQLEKIILDAANANPTSKLLSEVSGEFEQ